MSEVESELWLRIRRLELLVSGVVIEEDEGVDSTTVRRILSDINGPTPAEDEEKEIDNPADLVLRATQAHEEWRNLVSSKSRVTSAIDSLINVNAHCTEALEQQAAMEEGLPTSASALYKLKCVKEADWDSMLQGCRDLDNIAQLSSVLDKDVGVLEELVKLEQKAAHVKTQELARRESALQLQKQVAALWDRLRQAAWDARRYQLAWTLMLNEWEAKVEKELRSRGINVPDDD
ncbi:hypothetical protein DIPPA_30514 [Diplonema papillatum]|nr:hypothetical protein DIPPA_30514 [Diplonema papillatum]